MSLGQTLPVVAALLLLACVDEPPVAPVRDDAGAARADNSVLRLVTWNIETVGRPGSHEYNDALRILWHLDADLVALQEIAGATDAGRLLALADDAGYEHVHRGWPVSFGSDHNAVISRFPFADATVLDAPDLSPDPRANDVTRSFPRVVVDTPHGPLVAVTLHNKASRGRDDRFRRTVDAIRAVQAVGNVDPRLDAIVVAGDLNEDPGRLPLSPAFFRDLPRGLPRSYWLGGDIYDVLVDEGIDNDPFLPFELAGLGLLDPERRNGDEGTFIRSNDRLDHVWVSETVEVVSSEVYDDGDADLPGLDYLGEPPRRGTLSDASDHRPIVVDLRLPGASTQPPAPIAPGDLVITEVHPDPRDCSDEVGEYVELYNATDRTLGLAGLVLVDEAETEGALPDLRIPAGTHVQLGRGDGSGVCTGAALGGYGPIWLTNSGDRVWLIAGDQEISSSALYRGTRPGLSWSRTPDSDTWCWTQPSAGEHNPVCP